MSKPNTASPRVTLTEWNATRYGIIVAFNAVSRAECANNECRRHAVEVLNAIREPFYASKAAFVRLTTARDVTEPTWPQDCDEFEDAAPGGGYTIHLTPQAFKWMVGQVNQLPDSGAFATLRLAVDSSLTRAHEIETQAVVPPVE